MMAVATTSPDLVAGRLPRRAYDNLRGLNPHWEGKPGPPVPSYRRSLFEHLYRSLRRGLTPVTVLRGPRRVGKTVLLRQVIDQLLQSGVSPSRILYVPFDDIGSLTGIVEPVLALAQWYEQRVLGQSFNEAAHRDAPAYLLFDEVQNLAEWAPQIKHLVDNYAVRTLVTGSSSLRIEAGRDSLAGRITTLDLGPLLLREIAELHGAGPTRPIWDGQSLGELKRLEFWQHAASAAQSDMEPRLRAFASFSDRGAYPVAHERSEVPLDELWSYLNEAVVKRAIQHDLRMGERGRRRDERLLEEVFRLACRYIGQAPRQALYVSELQQALSANIGWQRILAYLRFLDGSLLFRLIDPLELRLKRKKGAPKLCLCDHTLRASWLGEVIPLEQDALARAPHLTDLAGHIAESTVGYFLSTSPHIQVAWFPERAAEPEVDFVITIGDRRIPLEVRYRRRIDPHRDTLGLRAFLEKRVYNAPFGILITQSDDVTVADPRIVTLSLSSFLWMR
jgi:predicted AAA+ superfamily ATPase